MNKKLTILILPVLLAGCGSDSQEKPPSVSPDTSSLSVQSQEAHPCDMLQSRWNIVYNSMRETFKKEDRMQMNNIEPSFNKITILEFKVALENSIKECGIFFIQNTDDRYYCTYPIIRESMKKATLSELKKVCSLMDYLYSNYFGTHPGVFAFVINEELEKKEKQNPPPK